VKDLILTNIKPEDCLFVKTSSEQQSLCVCSSLLKKSTKSNRVLSYLPLAYISNINSLYELVCWYAAAKELDAPAVFLEFKRLLAVFKSEYLLDVEVADLSLKSKGVISLCLMLSVPSMVMLISEAFLYLDDDNCNSLFAEVKRLKTEGASLIFISSIELDNKNDVFTKVINNAKDFLC